MYNSIRPKVYGNLHKDEHALRPIVSDVQAPINMFSRVSGSNIEECLKHRQWLLHIRLILFF